jgi:hypothetical protein
LRQAWLAALDEHEGLKLVLYVAPTSTLADALLKFSALPDDDDALEHRETTIERWKARDPAIVAAIERGLACLGS